MAKIEAGQILTVEGENGQEEIQVLGTLNVDGTEYAVAGLAEEIKRDADEDMEISFFRIDEEGGLHEVENDKEFQKVARVLEDHMKRS